MGGHLRHSFGATTELENAVLKLRDDFEQLRREFRDWQQRLVEGQQGLQQRIDQGQRSSGRWMQLLLAAGAIALLLAGGVAYWMDQRRQAADLTLIQQLTDLDTVKATARARAERDYRAAKGRAESLPATDQRQAELARLADEHDDRLDAIDRLFAMLRTGYRQGEINDITEEFQRILNDPSEQGGIDAAITYLHGKEAALLAEARRRLERRDEEERRARAALRSLLIAAGAAASEARPAEAERLFDRVLETDPDWPEALMAAGWFYRDRALFEDRHGTLAAALLLARKALSCAERLNADPPVTVEARRFQVAAELRMADILVERGQPGDAEQALAHYQRGLEVAERLLADNPRSARAARDLVVSHYKLATFGIQTGDEALAERHLGECHAVLHRYIEADITFDPPIMQLYQQLREIFGGD